MSTAAAEAPAPGGGSDHGVGGKGFLDFIERAGNKVPHPAVLFMALCLSVIVLSQVFAWMNISVTYEKIQPPAALVEEGYVGGSVAPTEFLPPEQADAEDYAVTTETAEIKSLLSADGIRFLFTSFVSNFMGFTAMGIILIVMIGVGLAESSGLIGALIRKLVAVTSAGLLTYVIVLLGVISSVASDAGYLVLIPLGAAAFMSVGRHPLAGIAAAFAGVAGGFGVNFLITPSDAILTEITNEAIALVEPGTTIDLASNLYFGIISTILVTLVCGFLTARIVEPRLGTYDPSLAPAPDEHEKEVEESAGVSAELEAKGLRWAGFALLGVIVLISALTLPSGAPLRDPETGSIIGTSPFMDSLIPIISLCFLATAIAYGRATQTITTLGEGIKSIEKSWAGLGALLFLFLLIAQFIAYFNYSNMANVAAVSLGDWVESANIGAAWLLLLVVIVTAIVNVLVPQAIAKWALLAPIFVPLLVRLGVDPAAVLAAYRVGDSPGNVVNPIMAYFPLVVVFAARYDKKAGIGTLIALMLPYFIVLSVVWTIFFMAWYVVGIPFGPG
ncbi:MAG: AbgT family transporter [Solirubrobacteraceae bacterium]|nr:AbgT family transporter [Solirubrobacteraceae bacterium]